MLRVCEETSRSWRNCRGCACELRGPAVDATRPVAFLETKQSKTQGTLPCRLGISCMATLSFVSTHACDPLPFGCRSTPPHPRRLRFLTSPACCDPPLPPVVNNTCTCRSLHTCSRPVCWRGHVTRMRDTLPTVCEPRPPTPRGPGFGG